MIYIKQKIKRGRKAIAMIELIFAIVIIGITLMSVPNLMSQASQSGYTTLQQEAVAAAATDLSLMLSRDWDEQDTDPSVDPSILITAGHATLSIRPGGRSRRFSTAMGGGGLLASTTLGSEANDTDDIDDSFSGGGHVEDGDQDLIDTVVITSTVNYLDDTGSANWDTSVTPTYNNPFGSIAAGTSNIKGVIVTLTSGSGTAELNKTVRFNAFACNIGSYKLERRVIP